jgi:hypothetical protein
MPEEVQLSRYLLPQPKSKTHHGWVGQQQSWEFISYIGHNNWGLFSKHPRGKRYKLAMLEKKPSFFLIAEMAHLWSARIEQGTLDLRFI